MLERLEWALLLQLVIQEQTGTRLFLLKVIHIRRATQRRCGCCGIIGRQVEVLVSWNKGWPRGGRARASEQVSAQEVLSLLPSDTAAGRRE